MLNLPESPKTNTFTLSREAIFSDSNGPEENSDNPRLPLTFPYVDWSIKLVQAESRAIRQNLRQSQFRRTYLLVQRVGVSVFFPGLSFQ